MDKAKIDLEQFVLMLQRKKKLPQVCIYHLNLILHSQVVLSDQRGWEPSSVLSPRKPSPRCLSVVRATGRRGTLERKIPMEMKRADVETTKAGGAADARSAEAFIVVKNVHPPVRLNMNEQLCSNAYMNMLLVLQNVVLMQLLCSCFFAIRLNKNHIIHWSPSSYANDF